MHVFEAIELFVITQYTLLKQSAVQNKISRAMSSFGKISASGKKPAIRYVTRSDKTSLIYSRKDFEPSFSILNCITIFLNI